MDNYTLVQTVSDSKEESIAKAITMLEGEGMKAQPLCRPSISMVKILLGWLLWLLITVGVCALWLHIANRLCVSANVSYLVAILICLIFLAVRAKAFVCNVVLLYQKYAPAKMRKSCLFEPSCSAYMLLAVEKYGVIVGVFKGICRLLRCHHPNGGEDYP